MDLTAKLMSEAMNHCTARGISLSRLATVVVNDGKFFRRVEAGGGFSVRTYERFMAYFREHPVENEGAMPCARVRPGSPSGLPSARSPEGFPAVNDGPPS